MSFPVYSYEKSKELFTKATKVVPSGIYGHLGPAEGQFIPVTKWPFFAEKAKGSYIWDVDGNKFDLKKYVDKDTGLISEKSKSGVTIKALELPGLWNGSMSDWNTVFVEVPIATFNPVKTVNDLLRPQHQG